MMLRWSGSFSTSSAIRFMVATASIGYCPAAIDPSMPSLLSLRVPTFFDDNSTTSTGSLLRWTASTRKLLPNRTWPAKW